MKHLDQDNNHLTTAGVLSLFSMLTELPQEKISSTHKDVLAFRHMTIEQVMKTLCTNILPAEIDRVYDKVAQTSEEKVASLKAQLKEEEEKAKEISKLASSAAAGP